MSQAAYHGVPIVGLPLFAEQPDNMARATEQGFGLSVSVDDALGLSQNLRRALLQILQNPGFAENANRVSRRIRATHSSPASQAASESWGHVTLLYTLFVTCLQHGHHECMQHAVTRRYYIPVCC